MLPERLTYNIYSKNSEGCAERRDFFENFSDRPIFLFYAKLRVSFLTRGLRGPACSRGGMPRCRQPFAFSSRQTGDNPDIRDRVQQVLDGI